MLAQDELMAQAKQKGNEMIRTAEERSRELRRAANEYCEDVMRRVEEALSEAHGEVQRSRTKFRAQASGAAPQGGRPTPATFSICTAAFWSVVRSFPPRWAAVP